MIKILLIALVKFPIELLIWILAPLVAVATLNKTYLTGPLSIFQDYNYGLKGDPYWVDSTRKDHPPTEEAAQSWIWRTRWIRRNANTLDHLWFGLTPTRVKKIEFSGNPKVGNRPGVNGLLRIWVETDTGSKYTEWYYVRRWGSSNRCIRIRIGWKLKDILDEYLKDNILGNDVNQRSIIPYVFSPNPLMGWSDK